jgi:spermidine dehydrogenase
MSDEKRDRELGMRCPISRRDFLNGVAVGVGGALVSESLLSGATTSDDDFAPEKAADYYPPALTGMRGNHDGTFTYAHRLRDGGKWNAAGAAAKTKETYDLVVVGGGISGLAAAYFYRKQAGNNPRILVLDNHDDFGGHAKRNEFRPGNRLLLGYGGTQSIESPGSYSVVAKDLLVQIGVQVDRFYKAYDQKLYTNLGTAAFFDKETFGVDRLLTGMNSTPWPEFLTKAPLSDKARRDIVRVYTEKADYREGLSKRSHTTCSELGLMPSRLRHATPPRTTTNRSPTQASTAWDFPNPKKKSHTFFISRMETLPSRVCWCAR